VKRDSVGGWLYAVAQRIAQEARAVLARRRVRERQVENMTHPEVAPAEPEDWRPILDREVARLPHRYREAVVLYHLEGWSHRETAAKLGVPEGTLASRLLMARRMLARRLARYGLSTSAIALESVLSERLAPAAVRALLAMETTRAAAGRLGAVSTPAALLTKGVLTTMFLNKLKIVLGAVMLVAVLGATGLAYRAGAQAPPGDRPAPGKPLSELEALRRENELLRLNLLVVLEKVRSQEAELSAFRGKGGTPEHTKRGENLRRAEEKAAAERFRELYPDAKGYYRAIEPDEYKRKVEAWLYGLPESAPSADAVKMVEEALKALRSSPDAEGQRRAAEALEKALRNLKARPRKQ